MNNSYDVGIMIYYCYYVRLSAAAATSSLFSNGPCSRLCRINRKISLSWVASWPQLGWGKKFDSA